MNNREGGSGIPDYRPLEAHISRDPWVDDLRHSTHYTGQVCCPLKIERHARPHTVSLPLLLAATYSSPDTNRVPYFGPKHKLHARRCCWHIGPAAHPGAPPPCPLAYLTTHDAVLQLKPHPQPDTCSRHTHTHSLDPPKNLLSKGVTSTK